MNNPYNVPSPKVFHPFMPSPYSQPLPYLAPLKSTSSNHDVEITIVNDRTGSFMAAPTLPPPPTNPNYVHPPTAMTKDSKCTIDHLYECVMELKEEVKQIKALLARSEPPV